MSRLSVSVVCSALLFIATNMSITSAVAQSTGGNQEPSDTELLDRLREQYSLDDPRRNHQNGRLSERITRQENPTSIDLRDRLQRLLNESQSNTIQYDFSGSANTQDPSSILQEQRRQALAIGRDHGVPNVQDNGDINLSYTKQGTRRLSRDNNGALQIDVVEGAENIRRVENVTQADLTSNEINNSDHVFDTPEGYGDDNQIRANVRNSHNVYRASTTSTGRAYQSVTGSLQQAINTNLDPNGALFQPSNQVIQGVNDNVAGEFFQSCEVSTESQNRELNFPDITEHRCQSNNTDNRFFCEVERDLRIPAVAVNGDLQSCGEGCFEMEFGSPDNNFFDPDGGCGVFSESRAIGFNLADGIELDRVVVDGHVDDHVEFTVNGELAYSVVTGVTSLNRGIPGTDFPGCEGGNNIVLGRRDIGGDRTFAFSRHIEEGVNDIYTIGWNVLVGGQGEIFGTIRFYFRDTTGQGFGEVETQNPPGCRDRVSDQIFDAGGYDALLATGIPQEDIEYSVCRFDSFNPLEVGTRGFPQEFLDELGPMYPGDEGNKTFQYEMAGYDCDPFGGQPYCLINPDTGEEECITWDELREQPNFCAEFEEDTTCSEVSRECTTEGWELVGTGFINADGELVENGDVCFNETVTYRCETDNTFDFETDVTTSTCDAALPCVGGECDLGENESNDNFLDAAVLANVIQNADADFSCENPSDPSSCTIFEGEEEYCSWEVTGLGTDCCESPDGINIIAYIQATQGVIKLNRLVNDGVFGQGVTEFFDIGVIDVVSDSLYVYAERPFTDAVSSVFGERALDNSPSLGIGALSETLSNIQQQVFQTINSALPESLSSLLFEAAGAESTNLVLNQSLVRVYDFISGAYTVYSLAKLALQLLTACDDNEIDMGVKLGQRLCTAVRDSYCSLSVLGLCIQRRQDYCCYNSILSRVVMEQAGPLLGEDLTNCRGLTPQEFGSLDFSQIDLSEWVGLLLESGEIQTEADEQSLTGGGSLAVTECEVYDVTDPVTGVVTTEEDCYGTIENGRILNAEGRQVVSDRTRERTFGAAGLAERVRRNALDSANNLDCSVSPRPPVCEFGIDPTDTNDGSN